MEIIITKLPTGLNLQKNMAENTIRDGKALGKYKSSNDTLWLKKDRGYTKKKTYGYKERNEEKRAKFLKVISTKATKNLLYIDESVIDNTEDYPYGYCQKRERFHALKSGKNSA